MANLEELVVEISADTKSLIAELKASTQATQQATQAMTKSVEEFSKNSSNNVGFFQSAMSTMAGVVGGELVIGALKTVKDAVIGLANTMITEGVAGAVAQQDAQNQLNQALARTGQYSKATADDMAAFASQIQATTKYEDDAILTTASLIQSMASLSHTGLKQATQAAADMSAALGIDLSSAARLVGKAMDGNVEALSRYGIKIQEGATKSETMANVLDELSKKFGGAAAAQAQTYSGQLTLIKNNFSEVQEAIGNTIVKNQAIIDVMKVVNTVISEMAKTMDENRGAFGQFVAEGLIVTIQAMKTLLEFAELVIQTFRGVGQAVESTFQTISDAGTALKSILTGDLLTALETFGEAIDEQGKKTDRAFSDPTVLNGFIKNLDKMGAAAETGYAKMIAGVDEADPKVNNLSNSVKNLTAAQLAAAEAGKKLGEQLIEQSDNAQAIQEAENENLAAALEAKAITEEEFWAAKMEAQDARYASEQAQLDAARKANLLSETQYHKATTQLEKQHDMDQRKMALEKKKFDDEMDKQRIANLSSTFGTISTLASSNNKTLSAIGKAAAITQASIDGYVAVQKALASAPPPFNYALAAAVGVAAAANVAKIVGTPLATGIDSVPGIGSRDNFPAILAPGERVVPRETNQDLTRFLEQGGAGQSQPGAPVEIVLTMKDNIMDFFEAQLVERSNLSLSLRGV